MLQLKCRPIRFLLLPALLLWASLSLAQTRQDSVAKIISYALEVYAKDTFSFTPAEMDMLRSASQNSEGMETSIDELAASSSTQLKMAGGNAKKWWQMGIATNGGGIPALVSTINEKLINGGVPAAKGWRQSNVPLLFTAPVNDFLKGVPTITNSNPPAGNETTLPQEFTTHTETNDTSVMLPFIALSLALLALAAALYALLYAKKRFPAIRESQLRQRADIDQLKTDIAGLKKGPSPATAASAKQATVAVEKLKTLEDRIRQLELQIEKGKVASAAVPPPVEALQVAEKEEVVLPSTSIPAAAQEPETSIRYAKRPDLGNGFSPAALFPGQNGERIYEITINGNTAYYEVSDDGKAQQYALSDTAQYLEGGCEMLNQPKPVCKIDTKEQGQLIKEGANWMIHKKARIEFV